MGAATSVLRSLEPDVAFHASVDGALQEIGTHAGRLAVVIGTAGHMVLGPLEPFTLERFSDSAIGGLLLERHGPICRPWFD
jgi:NAD(P)-dependent dehydrogenase (short-subunit alcohol dehydrogenase family)